MNCAGILTTCANPTCDVIVAYSAGPLPVERHTSACLKFQEGVRAEYEKHYSR